MDSSSKPQYYYAGGEKVEIQPDEDHIALDQRIAETAGFHMDGKRFEGAKRSASGIMLAERSAFNAEEVARLQKAGALRPVYRRGQTVLVALPEVRVEVDTSTQRDAVREFLKRSAKVLTVPEDTGGGLTFQPLSRDAMEALMLANEIFERAHPAAASVRFLQFVPKRNSTNPPQPSESAPRS